MNGLTVGRIVHYVDMEGIHRPCVITWVWNEAGTVNLHMFCDAFQDVDDVTLSSINFDDNQTVDSWHWIEPK